MPFRRQSSSTRRSSARSNAQPPTLRREDAEVIFEEVESVELSRGADRLVNTFNRMTVGHRISQAAPAGFTVNGRRLEPEPQPPAYTENPTAGEIRMEMTTNETLPKYTERDREQGKSQTSNEEGTSTIKLLQQVILLTSIQHLAVQNNVSSSTRVHSKSCKT